MKECEKCLPPCLQEQLVLHSHALCFTLFRSRQVSLCCCFKANQANADFDLSVRWFYTAVLHPPASKYSRLNVCCDVVFWFNSFRCGGIGR